MVLKVCPAWGRRAAHAFHGSHNGDWNVCSRSRIGQLGFGSNGGYERRMDRPPYRHQGAEGGGGRRVYERSLHQSGGKFDGALSQRLDGCRLYCRLHGDAGLSVSGHGVPHSGTVRHTKGRGGRSERDMRRIRVRSAYGECVDRIGNAPKSARRRRRNADENYGLHRPHDLYFVRRRGGSGFGGKRYA